MFEHQFTRFIALFLGMIALCFLTASPVKAQQQSVSGKLKPTVEAGGWLIVDEKEKYLLLNAEKFRNENWFRVGTQVIATGEVKRGAVTIYQEGIPFEARTLQPAVGSANKRSTTATVFGSARITALPDTAIVTISVITQSGSALEAQQQNAAKTTRVLDALRKTVPAAEIKTSGYSLVPQRVYKENLPPTISGFEARNTVTVTLSDLNRVGAVIDAATRAGANNIDTIAFTLRQDKDERGKALAEALRDAMAKANVLAQTLGGRVVRIIAVEEIGNTPRPVLYTQRETLATQTADTPIEIGTIEINSQVNLIAEIEINED